VSRLFAAGTVLFLASLLYGKTAQGLTNSLRETFLKVCRESLKQTGNIINMPRIFLRKLKSFYISARYFLSRMTNIPFVHPDFIQINLTNRCNLRCRICNVYKAPSSVNQELTTAEIKQIVLQSVSLGPRRIVLSGGEPFLRSDLFEIVSFVKENTKMEIVITTNGALIDSELARKIIQAPINHLQISLDGAFKEAHDSVRGEGAFLKTTEAIKTLNKLGRSGLSLGLSFTVTQANYKEMRSFLDLARDLDVGNVLFIPLIEDNSYRHDKQMASKALFTTREAEEFDRILEQIGEFKKKYARPTLSNFNNLSLYAKYFSGNLAGLRWRCYAGFHWIQVNPTGDMQMCGREFGNIRNRSLKDVWHSPQARNARIEIKRCRRLCLQPCMSMPSE